MHLVTPFRLGAALPPLSAFDDAERAGLIWSRTVKTAGGLTYRLFNYSKEAQYARVWTPVTRIARGLIVCLETGEIVAAPLAKFFNMGEKISDNEVASARSGPFEALVKMDGALGIGYRLDGRLCWATRGSFESEQSVVAQKMWDAKYAHHTALFFNEWLHLTPMTEIIHPRTRQVVRYPYQDLVLIACRNRFSGEYVAHEGLVEIGERLGMPVVERLTSDDLTAILRRVEELDENEEGFVLHWFADGHRVKVKGEPYKRLHAILSGVTPTQMAWEWYEGSLADTLVVMPEEFREETEAFAAALEERVLALVEETEAAFAAAPKGDQRQFAQWVNKSAPQSLKGFLFARHQQSQEKAASVIAASALSDLIRRGRLASVLDEKADAELLFQVALYERAVADLLWNEARTAPGRVRLNALVARLPRELRGSLAAAIEKLRPEEIVAKMRAYVKQRTGPLAQVDVDAIFSQAPAPDSPIALHKQWVFNQPLLLRTFLDNWRAYGRYESAVNGARHLLAQAVRANQVHALITTLTPMLSGDHPSEERLATMLGAVADRILGVWNALPHAGGPRALSQAVNSLGSVDRLFAHALLREAWDGERKSVRDSVRPDDKLLTFQERFEES